MRDIGRRTQDFLIECTLGLLGWLILARRIRRALIAGALVGLVATVIYFCAFGCTVHLLTVEVGSKRPTTPNSQPTDVQTPNEIMEESINELAQEAFQGIAIP
ncbi:MAG: hypothetical protein KAV00_12010 [Phycisphaerae bacterium]|nr:hypothetical protein [Phycisphaerae bacterium]